MHRALALAPILVIAACDIGAVEADDVVFVDTLESGDTSFWSATTP